MGILSIIFVLSGVFLSFGYMQSDLVDEQGFTAMGFAQSPGFGMIMLGLVMYHVAGRAKKRQKKGLE